MVLKGLCGVKPAFHDANTNTDILARIVARMSACRSACHRNNFRKSRLCYDVSVRLSVCDGSALAHYS